MPDLRSLMNYLMRAGRGDLINDWLESPEYLYGAPAPLGAAPPHIPKRGKPPRKKRRKTKYQAAYSAAYKRLKKKHPRMSFGSLSKKAHAAARKKVK